MRIRSGRSVAFIYDEYIDLFEHMRECEFTIDLKKDLPVSLIDCALRCTFGKSALCVGNNAIDERESLSVYCFYGKSLALLTT